LEWRNLSKTS